MGNSKNILGRNKLTISDIKNVTNINKLKLSDITSLLFNLINTYAHTMDTSKIFKNISYMTVEDIYTMNTDNYTLYSFNLYNSKYHNKTKLSVKFNIDTNDNIHSVEISIDDYNHNYPLSFTINDAIIVELDELQDMIENFIESNDIDVVDNTYQAYSIHDLIKMLFKLCKYHESFKYFSISYNQKLGIYRIVPAFPGKNEEMLNNQFKNIYMLLDENKSYYVLAYDGNKYKIDINDIVYSLIKELSQRYNQYIIKSAYELDANDIITFNLSKSFIVDMDTANIKNIYELVNVLIYRINRINVKMRLDNINDRSNNMTIDTINDTERIIITLPNNVIEIVNIDNKLKCYVNNNDYTIDDDIISDVYYAIIDLDDDGEEDEVIDENISTEQLKNKYNTK